MSSQDFHVLAMVKGEHQFVYMFDDDGWEELVQALSDQAEDPNLLISWFDAALISHRAKNQIKLSKKEPLTPSRLPR